MDPYIKITNIASGEFIACNEVNTIGFGWEAQPGMTGLGLPPREAQFDENAGDGAVLRGVRIQNRSLDLILHLHVINRNTLKLQLNKFARVTSSKVRIEWIDEDADEDWYVDGVMSGGGNYVMGGVGDDTNNTQTDLRMPVTFTTESPYWTFVEPKYDFQGSIVGDVVTFNVNNPGSHGSAPTFAITGPTLGFTITNEAGDSLTYTALVEDGEVIRVEMDTGRVYATQGGNRYNYLLPGSRFWKLPPGVSTVTVTLDRSSAEYTDAYFTVNRNFIINPNFDYDVAGDPVVETTLVTVNDFVAAEWDVWWNDIVTGTRFGPQHAPSGSGSLTCWMEWTPGTALDLSAQKFLRMDTWHSPETTQVSLIISGIDTATSETVTRKCNLAQTIPGAGAARYYIFNIEPLPDRTQVTKIRLQTNFYWPARNNGQYRLAIADMVALNKLTPDGVFGWTLDRNAQLLDGAIQEWHTIPASPLEKVGPPRASTTVEGLTPGSVYYLTGTPDANLFRKVEIQSGSFSAEYTVDVDGGTPLYLQVPPLPADTATFTFEGYETTSGDQTLYDMHVEEVCLSAYDSPFNGDTADMGSVTYDWDGTPGQSTSTRVVDLLPPETNAQVTLAYYPKSWLVI